MSKAERGFRQSGRLLLFARATEPGHTKTRLIPRLGAEGAASLAAAFVSDGLARAARAAPTVLATTRFPDVVEFAVEAWLQPEGDLGHRLETLLRRSLETAAWTMALGADSPDLPDLSLLEAIGLLSDADAVLGPTEDGGYWCLGLKRCPAGLLSDLPWSSPRTFAATKARLEERGLSVAIAPRWWDVDEPEDLDRLQCALERTPGRAPHTEAWFRKHSASERPVRSVRLSS